MPPNAGNERPEAVANVEGMATIFTRIIDGDLPAAFAWQDEVCVAFMSINPIRTGHTLVVPRAEVEHWIDLPSEVMGHVTEVAREIGRAVQKIWNPNRVGLIVAGYEVPHTHMHVIPTWTMADLDFRNAASAVERADLEAAAAAIAAEMA